MAGAIPVAERDGDVLVLQLRLLHYPFLTQLLAQSVLLLLALAIWQKGSVHVRILAYLLLLYGQNVFLDLRPLGLGLILLLNLQLFLIVILVVLLLLLLVVVQVEGQRLDLPLLLVLLRLNGLQARCFSRSFSSFFWASFFSRSRTISSCLAFISSRVTRPMVEDLSCCSTAS